MLFNSSQFLIFFPLVVLIYYILPNKLKCAWLLAASYYFYMCWNVRYILLLIFSTIVTYLSGLALQRIHSLKLSRLRQTHCKKAVVAVSFTLNLMILFYFKYANFTFTIINNLLNAIHLKINTPSFDLLLPVGISFYTFQALGYTLDVYRGDINAERNILKYALFVSFFPQLVAGPIERSKNLLKQLTPPRKYVLKIFVTAFCSCYGDFS